MQAVLLLAALWPGVSFAAEPPTLGEIAAQLESPALLRAEFEQSKQMAALKKPLLTRGRLAFSKEFGVLWQIEQPYRMTYVLGEQRIVEIGTDGVRRERGLRDVPGLAQVSRLLRALLAADTGALVDNFAVSATGEAGKWALALTPRQAPLSQFLSAVELSGGRFVERLTIVEASGDRTQIRLRNAQGSVAPNDAERELFVGSAPAGR